MLNRIDDILHGMMMAVFCMMTFLAFHNARKEYKPVRLNVALGLLMGMMTIQSLEYLICSLLQNNQNIVADMGLSLSINLLTVPFCNMVVMELTHYRRMTVGMMLWQLGIPLLLAATYYVLLLWGMSCRHLVLMVYITWTVVFSTYYFFHIVKAAHVYERLIEDVYADTEWRRIDWLKRILLQLIGVTVLFLILKVFIRNDVARLAYIPLCLVFWLTLCWYILQMRCVDSIEITGETLEESADETDSHARMEDYTGFLASLRQTLLSGHLFAQENLTRDIVAKKMSTNYKYLTQQLKDATGLTFSAYVNEVRLEESTRLLRNTDMTVEEVFYACGYQTKSTYYRAFGKKYGCTPLEYRRGAGGILAKTCEAESSCTCGNATDFCRQEGS